MSDAAISAEWRRLRATGRVALIPYLTAGFPDRDTSLAAIRMSAESGADFIEVGMPFSDPLADGPVIQHSTHVALEGGMTVRGAIDLIREAAVTTPIVAFGYLNPILAYGLPRFLDDAARAGITGLLLTDLPTGEHPDVEAMVRASPLALISLIAPTTSEERLRRIVGSAEGFIYLISRLGVTGPSTKLDDAVAAHVQRVRAETDLPIAIGFGIAEADQAATVARYADGVVVGSALVRRLSEGIDSARDLVQALRGAIDAAHRAL